jgi:hypothetical protein
MSGSPGDSAVVTFNGLRATGGNWTTTDLMIMVAR